MGALLGSPIPREAAYATDVVVNFFDGEAHAWTLPDQFEELATVEGVDGRRLRIDVGPQREIPTTLLPIPKDQRRPRVKMNSGYSFRPAAALRPSPLSRWSEAQSRSESTDARNERAAW
jgi:hypothetical protein